MEEKTAIELQAEEFLKQIKDGKISIEQAIANKDLVAMMAHSKELSKIITGSVDKIVESKASGETREEREFYKALCISQADKLLEMDDYQLEQFRDKAKIVAKIILGE